MLSVYAGLSLGVSGLILLMLALKPLLKKRYSARCAYLAWILLCAFLVVPFGKLMPKTVLRVVITLPEETERMTVVPSSAAQPASTETIKATSTVSVVGESTASSQAAEQSVAAVPLPRALRIDSKSLIVAIWLFGIFAFLLYTCAGCLAFRLRLKRLPAFLPDDGTLEQFRQAQAEIGGARKAELVVVSGLPSPFLMGILHPKVYLPEDSVDCPGLKMILKHELIHLKRHDLPAKLLAIAANAIHWFNPLVYILRRRMEEDCEFSCDEQVLKDEPMENRYFYGETVLAVSRRAAHLSTVLTSNFNPRKGTMKMRLQGILDSKKKKSGILALTALFLVAAMLSSMVVFADEDQSKTASFFGTFQVPSSVTEVKYYYCNVELYIGGKLAGGAKVEPTNGVDPDRLPIANDFVDDSRVETINNGLKAFDTAQSSLQSDAKEHHYYVIASTGRGGNTVFDFYGIDGVAPDGFARQLAESWVHDASENKYFIGEGYTSVPIDKDAMQKIQDACDAGTDTDSLDYNKVAQKFIDQLNKNADENDKYQNFIFEHAGFINEQNGRFLSDRELMWSNNSDRSINIRLVQPLKYGNSGAWAVIAYCESEAELILPDDKAPTLEEAKRSAVYTIGDEKNPTNNLDKAEEFAKKFDEGTPAQVDFLQYDTKGELLWWSRLTYDGTTGSYFIGEKRTDGGYSFYKERDFKEFRFQNFPYDPEGSTWFITTIYAPEGHNSLVFVLRTLR